jgi:hypothetical protein
MKYLIIVLFSLTPAAFAGTWSGILVDADCYHTATTNVSPTNTVLASRDLSGDVTSCLPTKKTKSFAIVQEDWTALKLDPSANAQVADLVQSSGKKARINVTVTGERHKNTIAVESLTQK